MSVKHHNEPYQAPWDEQNASKWEAPKETQSAQGGQSAQGKKETGKEESLTTLLDEDQRGELTLLIATAMAAMRKTITSSFDANVGWQLLYSHWSRSG